MPQDRLDSVPLGSVPFRFHPQASPLPMIGPISFWALPARTYLLGSTYHEIYDDYSETADRLKRLSKGAMYHGPGERALGNISDPSVASEFIIQ
jgi:hypothetical protein